MLQALLQARAPLDLVGMASSFVTDEIFHVELTSRLAMQLGGASPHVIDFSGLRHRTSAKTPALRANELVVRVCCVGEAFSIPMLSGAMRSAAHPLTRAILETIVKDEAPHARLGWLYLEWAGEQLDDAESIGMRNAARSLHWTANLEPDVVAPAEPQLSLYCGYNACKNDRMISRLLAPRLRASRKSVLLLGPRQTGKSTLMHSLKPDLQINLARESELLTFAANPGELEERIAMARPSTVFVDEVQRLPTLLNTIQALIDDTKRAGKPLKFYLTGSSARKLRRGRANLLPGRVLTYSLGPLCAAELNFELNIRRALELGALPEPYTEADRAAAEKLLASYSGTYLREEIQAEALSRNIEGFSRFLTIAANASGQLLDYSKLAQRARVSRTTTVRYYELLEDTLLTYRLPPFAGAPKADLVKHPKFYFFDPGVLNGLLGNFTASADRVGNLFEHLVVSQVRAAAMAFDKEIEISTFRTRGGLEIDFIISAGNTTWAVEAKTTTNIQGRDAEPLEAAKSYLPRNTRRIITTPGGASRRLANGVEVFPLPRLLQELV